MRCKNLCKKHFAISLHLMISSFPPFSSPFVFFFWRCLCLPFGVGVNVITKRKLMMADIKGECARTSYVSVRHKDTQKIRNGSAWSVVFVENGLLAEFYNASRSCGVPQQIPMFCYFYTTSLLSRRGRGVFCLAVEMKATTKLGSSSSNSKLWLQCCGRLLKQELRV